MGQLSPAAPRSTLVWDRNQLRAAVRNFFEEQGWEYPFIAVSLDNLVVDLQHAVAWFYLRPGTPLTEVLTARLKNAVDAVTGRSWEIKSADQRVIRLRRFEPGTPLYV